MNEETNTPEPLAAILAEMRDFARPLRVGGDLCSNVALPATIGIWADRIEAAVQRFVADDCAKCAHYNAATISLKDALDLANTIANHGINANDLGDKASATIYALCHEVRTVRGEDANIKQEVQKLRRELRDLRRAPGNDAAMREALEYVLEKIDAWRTDGTMEHWQYSQLFDTCDAALAAPARNCDLFATANDAVESYIAAHPYDNEPDASTYGSWLFAPAEGGDHAYA